MSPPIRVVFFDLGETLILTSTRSWVPGARETLADLRARGLRLGVISNTGALQREQLAELLPPDFDWGKFEPGLVVLSSEVGIEKPDPAIFNVAATASGGLASACAFCTESQIDALVAQRVGFLAARVEHPPHSDVADLPAALARAGLITNLPA